MVQEFYIDNLISRFIKCLLWDTYIPSVGIWREGKNLIKGLTYITQDKNIVVAKKDYRVNIDRAPKNSLDNEYFTIVSNYVEGDFYRGITSNFESNSSLYDPDTHYALGQYLRYIRDMHDLDLMPFYNCYSGISADKIRINKGELITDNNINDGLISYIVPIKFNQDYTLYYDSEVPFYIMPIYYDGINVTRVKDSKGVYFPAERINRCSNKSPYLVKSKNFDGDSLIYINANQRIQSDYFALLVQVPKNSFSNLLVLEGNYTDVKTNLNNNKSGVSINRLPEILIGSQDTIKLSDVQLNNIFKPYPSLTENISDTNYAFSDRLIEYLLYSPIIKNDRIRYDIKRVQENVSSKEAAQAFGLDNVFDETYIPDIWNTNLRYYIYNLITQKIDVPLYKDLNGYVDKDTEFIIDKGKKIEGGLDV